MERTQEILERFCSMIKENDRNDDIRKVLLSMFYAVCDADDVYVCKIETDDFLIRFKIEEKI